jgi:hypothetical protein
MNKFSRFTNKCLSIGGERYVQMLNGKECLKNVVVKSFKF